MKNRFQLISTILIIIVITAIIAYPKIKPYLKSKSRGPDVSGGLISQGKQILNVNGYIIRPEKFSDIKTASGTLWPDEVLDDIFRTALAGDSRDFRKNYGLLKIAIKYEKEDRTYNQ